jgi:excisionase family DNA binding protein
MRPNSLKIGAEKANHPGDVRERRISDARVSSTEQPEAPADLAAPFLSIEQVAKVLQVSTKTVRRRIKSGHLSVAPLGKGVIRIPESELRRLGGTHQDEPCGAPSNSNGLA